MLRRNVSLALEACQRHSLAGTGLTFQLGVRIFPRTIPRTCRSGGIGRRARFRVWSGLTGWRFESSLRHLYHFNK
jgi:hypothetical protein